MFIRITSHTEQFDLIPYGFFATDGTRVIFADTDSAAQFLEQFRRNDLALRRLNDLYDDIVGLIQAGRVRDDNQRLKTLAREITGLSGGPVAVIRREPDEASSRRGGGAAFSAPFALAASQVAKNPTPISRPITDAERCRWAEPEPVPAQKYKIVVEVAGKHLKPLNGRLELKPTPEKDDSGHDAYFHNDTGSNKHRVVLCFDNVPNKPRQLYYVIGTNRLPLCMHVTPVEREAQAQQWANVLIPLIPVCRYIPQASSRPDSDTEAPTDLITALPPGWLYIYLNGYLWREIQIDSYTGVLRDVDLAAHPGKQQRPANGQWFDLLLVPHQLNGATQAVQLAYARQQWTWTQLCQTGGIDPSDPRFLPVLKQRSANIAVDPAFQHRHLTTLDLSSYNRGFESTNAIQVNADQANADQANADPVPEVGIRAVATAPEVIFDDPPLPPRDLLAKYRHLNIPVVTLNDLPMSKTDINISLSYTDSENTPATDIPYLIRFANGQTRKGILDNKGNAAETNVPVCGAEIEFCYEDSVDTLNQALAGHYRQLKAELNKHVQAIGERVEQAFTHATPAKPQTEPQAEPQAKPLSKEEQIKADFAASVREKIEALKTQAHAYDDLAWYEKSWENIKATGTGLGDGITEYIPDLGEFGDLIDHMKIDITTIIQAIATGDITQLEQDFQDWQDRVGQGYEQASQTMEMLIVLLSDRQTRELLASVPKRFLEVTPTDQLVELAVSQGTQFGVDGVVVVAATAGGAAISGPGGAVTGALAVSATTARKASKALQAVTDILMKMAKTLKKKRNKRKSNTIEHNKTALPDNRQEKQKELKKCGFSFNETNKCDKPYNKKCPLCNKRQRGEGNNKRNPTTLKNGIQNNWRKKQPAFTLPRSHPWYQNPGSLAQHHVIPVEVVGGAESSPHSHIKYWETLFDAFEYDINDAHNSIVLPAIHELACQLAVPLHNNNHGSGRGDPGLNYVSSVEQLLQDVERDVKLNKYCSQSGKFTTDMSSISQEILEHLDEFIWTLTEDGDDYSLGAPGCQGAIGSTFKKNQALKLKSTCSKKPPRQHDIQHEESNQPMHKDDAHPSGILRIGY